MEEQLESMAFKVFSQDVIEVVVEVEVMEYKEGQEERVDVEMLDMVQVMALHEEDKLHYWVDQRE